MQTMIIRLEEIPESRLPEFKGGEKELRANMFFDGTNRMFKGTLVPGASIGIHTHDDSIYRHQCPLRLNAWSNDR